MRENGVFGSKAGRDGKNSVDLGGRRIIKKKRNVGFGMGHAAREYFSHGSQIDTDAIRTACQ